MRLLIARKDDILTGIINAFLIVFYMGIMVMVIVVVATLCSGCAGSSQIPSVIVHKYDYQAKPPALVPGTPPSPPDKAPETVDYQTVYPESSGSDWGDPTLVVFKNESYRVMRLSINGQPEIKLAGYQATADIHLPIGEHRIRLVIEKPTAAHGTWEVVRFLPISIRPEGQAQIFHLYE